MSLEVGEVCTFCRYDCAVIPALVRLRLDVRLLPGQWEIHDGLLLDDGPIYACGEHIESLQRVAHRAIDGATQRMRVGVR